VLAGALVSAVIAPLLPSAARGGAVIYESDDFSVEIGLRMQPRFSVFKFPEPGEGVESRRWQRDFLIRRARIKLGGKMMGAKYYMEWRLDSTGLLRQDDLERDDLRRFFLTTPIVGVENAYIQWPLGGLPELQLRFGLYDQPFSRDRLTSDSKQLAVDRGAVSNVPAALGLADNAIGFDLRGDIKGGRYQYAVGLFDNRTIPNLLQTVPMVVGRIDFNFGATHNIYRDAHFGDDSWYSLGINGSYQPAPEDTVGTNDGHRAAFGVDGMVDVPAGAGRLIAVAELNGTREENPADVVPTVNLPTLNTLVWMVGLGFSFLGERLQPIVRFDQIRLDEDQGSGVTNITHVGLNFYQRGHNLKVQGDVRFETDTADAVDGVRIQAQIDY
jgi:hypothetical protein